MVEKTSIVKNLNFLISSARSRNTDQGTKVYENAKNMILDASSEEEISEILNKLNHALIGIEAHGHYTSEEYEVVSSIRRLGNLESS